MAHVIPLYRIVSVNLLQMARTEKNTSSKIFGSICRERWQEEAHKNNILKWHFLWWCTQFVILSCKLWWYRKACSNTLRGILLVVTLWICFFSFVLQDASFGYRLVLLLHLYYTLQLWKPIGVTYFFAPSQDHRPFGFVLLCRCIQLLRSYFLNKTKQDYL